MIRLARKRLVAAVLLCGLLAVNAATARHTAVPAPSPDVTATTVAPSSRPIAWFPGIESALGVASTEYRPVVVLFTSPSCGWCKRLKAELAEDEEARELLAAYVTADIDITIRPEEAQRYGVRSVPTMLFMSGNGRVRGGYTGYAPVDVIKRRLAAGLNPDMVPDRDDDAAELLASVENGEIEPAAWPRVMRLLGETEMRQAVRETVLARSRFPSTNLVSLLRAPGLAVRIGAIELLEERTGDDFGYDPWVAPGDADSLQAVKRWRQWAANERPQADTAYASLTGERINDYIRDLVSGDRMRATRAMRMLEQGGRPVARALAEVLKTPQLGADARLRVREVQYTILIGGESSMDASTVSHRLIFGTTDVRLQALRDLAGIGIGVRAVPILRDFMEGENSLLREVACEGLIRIAGAASAPIVREFLAAEDDDNVVYTALHALGAAPGDMVVDLLGDHLRHENEDLVVAALHALSKHKGAEIADPLRSCPRDPRWRVRVAAIETAAQLGLKALGNDVLALAEDKDEFVRRTAAKSLAKVLDADALRERIEPLLAGSDQLKPFVVEQLGRLQMRVPRTVIASLWDAPKDIVMQTLQALAKCTANGAEIAAAFIDSDDLDVSCAALQTVARLGAASERLRGRMVGVLDTGDPTQKLVVLEHLQIAPEQFAAYRSCFRHWFDGGDASANKPQSAVDPVVDDIMAAFDGAGSSDEDEPDGEQKSARANVDDILSAFTAQEPSTADRGVSLDAFVRRIEGVMQEAGNPELRLRAALRLAALGNPHAVEPLLTALPDETAAVRGEIAEAAEGVTQWAAAELNRRLLRDESSQIRKAGVGNCLSMGEARAFDLMVEELRRDEAELQLSEVFSYRLQSFISETPGAGVRCRERALELLAPGATDSLRAFALVLLSVSGNREDVERIRAFTEDENPYLRRAAYQSWFALGRDACLDEAERIASDSVGRVRIVLPLALQGQDMRSWAYFFSESEVARNVRFSASFMPDPFSAGRGGQTDLPETAEGALWELTEDASVAVRVEAFLALLHHRKPVRLDAFARTLNAAPDAKAVADKVAAFLYQNRNTLGEEFKVLLPFVERSGSARYFMPELRKQFGSSEADAMLAVTILDRPAATDVTATFTAAPTPAPRATKQVIEAVYFFQPGCRECRRVKRQLADLRKYFPEVKLRAFDLHTVDAMRLNEYLCGRFGVAERARLVAPAVFLSSGALIKDDISFDALVASVMQASADGREAWWRPPEDELKQAERTIASRFNRMSMTIIIAAGLLDGVNPCAFAAILLFVSYLHIARRTPRQILQVGVAFILAVFLAYFAVGLGLFHMFAGLAALGTVSSVVNGILAAVVLLLGLLSLRDGVTCLRGRSTEMALQLPGALKARIRGVVRTGARHREFVVAAFVSGLAISILELACTGQVYLPTVTYMVRESGMPLDALGYLLAYNAAFVTPLVVIFAATAGGLRQGALVDFMTRHTAAVKFATAALFFALFAIFLLR